MKDAALVLGALVFAVSLWMIEPWLVPAFAGFLLMRVGDS